MGALYGVYLLQTVWSSHPSPVRRGVTFSIFQLSISAASCPTRRSPSRTCCGPLGPAAPMERHDARPAAPMERHDALPPARQQRHLRHSRLAAAAGGGRAGTGTPRPPPGSCHASALTTKIKHKIRPIHVSTNPPLYQSADKTGSQNWLDCSRLFYFIAACFAIQFFFVVSRYSVAW